MVDAADLDKMEASRNELHSLLDKPQLSGIPVLVLGNKRDLPGALDETGLIERMQVHILRTTIYILNLLYPTGTCQAYRIGKFVAIVYLARKKTTSTLRFNGSSPTQKVKPANQKTDHKGIPITNYPKLENNSFSLCG